ncbi:2,3-bisphosphoglycerate-dependent phosphoglycerate mutase [Salinibacillus kushneri]|uniref:2,3-bisphosphoglycerate-dependent phosphoglycerate mutase n=1 Tax=Salinibacillus kushneri TaxID=237682 RepID=A0A1I0DWT4_9BACI|nr:histidine phosphatase family protein [Salinibacillus kushneri]SET36331.1 2,3-bisphosphoglycerate-dependent phosphoglycerate mutase [Salinibacillus kushneri]
MEKNIYVVRHCEATGQSSDSPLTTRGFQQREELKSFFKGIPVNRILSSLLLRARQSISLLASERDLPLEIDDRLTERILSTVFLNNWLDKLKATFSDMDLAYNGGESSKEAMNRSMEVVKDVLNRDEKNTVIITHGNLMALLLKNFDSGFGFEEWKSLTNPDIYHLIFRDQKTELKRIWNGWNL